MKLSIFIEDSFDSAHWLPLVPDCHQCKALHGHTYRVRLEFSGEINAMGWILDYAEAKAQWKKVKDALDHKCLNDVIENPTCELLAIYIMERIPASRIELRETEHCGVVVKR